MPPHSSKGSGRRVSSNESAPFVEQHDSNTASPYKRRYSALEFSPRQPGRHAAASSAAVPVAGHNGNSHNTASKIIQLDLSEQVSSKDTMKTNHKAVYDVVVQLRELMNDGEAGAPYVSRQWWALFEQASEPEDALSDSLTLPPLQAAYSGEEGIAVPQEAWILLNRHYGAGDSISEEGNDEVQDEQGTASASRIPVSPTPSSRLFDMTMAEPNSDLLDVASQSSDDADVDEDVGGNEATREYLLDVSSSSDWDDEGPFNYINLIPVGPPGPHVMRAMVPAGRPIGKSIYKELSSRMSPEHIPRIELIWIRSESPSIHGMKLEELMDLMSNTPTQVIDRQMVNQTFIEAFPGCTSVTLIVRLLDDPEGVFAAPLNKDSSLASLVLPVPTSSPQPSLPDVQNQRSLSPVVTPGTTGLSNMGNTCYMNSALQCLLHVEELIYYFLTKEYKKELNPDNPIGCNGDMAEAFGKLVEVMAPGGVVKYAPREFKNTLVKYAQMFAGWSQQDSQEFLAFLLDSLHEDLNRIHKKPAVPKPELSEGASPHDIQAIVELGRESWETHKMRNDSVILDLFTGMYRSILVCPECDRVSVTFDPFMDLTLPLPSTNNMWIKDVYVVPLPNRGNGVPLVIQVCLDRNSNMRQLKEYLGRFTGIDADLLIGAEIFRSAFFTFYSDRDIVSDKCKNEDLVVFYELSEEVYGDLTEGSIGEGDEEETPDDRAIAIPVSFVSSSSKAMGWPIILAVNSSLRHGSYEDLVALVKERFLTSNIESEELETAISSNISGMRYGPHHIPGSFPGVDAEMDGEQDGDGELQMVESGVERNIASEDDMEVIEGTALGPTMELKYTERVMSRMMYPQIRTTEARSLLERVREEGAYILVDEKDVGDTELSSWSHMDDETEDNPTARSEGDSDEMPIQTQQTDASSDVDLTIASPVAGSDIALPKAAADAADGTNNAVISLINRGEKLIGEWTATHLYKVKDAQRIDNPEADQALREIEEKRKQVASLSDCLDVFSQTEVLSREDSWYCSKCKDMRQASKTIQLWKVPDIIIIHLKRFASFRSFRDKIDDPVDFPLEGLDIRPWIGDPNIQNNPEEDYLYDLIGIDNHMGGLRGGHYTATVKNFVDGKWYNYNDEFVSPVEPPTQSREAYLLIYRRRTRQKGDTLSQDSNKLALGGEYLNAIVQKGEEIMKNWDFTKHSLIAERPVVPPPPPPRYSSVTPLERRYPENNGYTLGSEGPVGRGAVVPWMSNTSQAFGMLSEDEQVEEEGIGYGPNIRTRPIYDEDEDDDEESEKDENLMPLGG